MYTNVSIVSFNLRFGRKLILLLPVLLKILSIASYTIETSFYGDSIYVCSTLYYRNNKLSPTYNIRTKMTCQFIIDNYVPQFYRWLHRTLLLQDTRIDISSILPVSAAILLLVSKKKIYLAITYVRIHTYVCI